MGSYDTVRFAPELNERICKAFWPDQPPLSPEYQTKDLGCQLNLYTVTKDLIVKTDKSMLLDVVFCMYGGMGKEIYVKVDNGKIRTVGWGIDGEGYYPPNACIIELSETGEIDDTVDPTELRFIRMANELMELG